MVLANSEIWKCIQKGDITISPEVNHRQLGPCGIKLHLHHEILLPTVSEPFEPDNLKTENFIPYQLQTDPPFLFKPGGFFLGKTVENIRTNSHIIPFLDGRSTFARCGISIFNSSMLLDGCWNNEKTSVLEISNIGSQTLIIKPA